MSILVLQSSWWGRESWLLCLICLPGVLWWLSGSSSRCHGVVCSLWLWYFLIILTYYFLACVCCFIIKNKLHHVKTNTMTCVPNAHTCSDPERFVRRGKTFFLFVCCLNWWGEGGSKYHYMWVITGPSAKCLVISFWERLASWLSCVWCFLMLLSLSLMTSQIGCGAWLYQLWSLFSSLLRIISYFYNVFEGK